VYVFCLQSNLDPGTWDALNLNQWEFYVLSKARVEGNGCKTMGISTLRSLTSAVEPERLREAVIAANAEQGEN